MAQKCRSSVVLAFIIDSLWFGNWKWLRKYDLIEDAIFLERETTNERRLF